MPASPRSGVLKTGNSLAALAVLLDQRQVHLVVAADLLAVAAKEERRVVDCAIRLDRVAAQNEIHLVRRGRTAESFEHSRHRDRQHFIERRPGCAASHLSRPSVSSGNASASHFASAAFRMSCSNSPSDVRPDAGPRPGRRSSNRSCGSWAAQRRCEPLRPNRLVRSAHSATTTTSAVRKNPLNDRFIVCLLSFMAWSLYHPAIADRPSGNRTAGRR